MASYKNYSVGDRVWIPHDEDAWLSARVEKVSSTLIEFVTDRGIIKAKPSIDPSFRYEACGSHINDNIENLVDLDELSEGAILHHIRKRYFKKLIYTYVGSILVAVNPFEKLDIYSDQEVSKARSTLHLYPHVFVTTSQAYKQLQTNSKNQSILISGESGAGKTETTKKVLSYLSKVAPSSKPKQANEPGIEVKILQSNPLLEALGNAKTLRNNNSSRFGKWMKIEFDRTFNMQGCEIINYLLEKSRVVHQSIDERNYHIFYQLLSTQDPHYRSSFRLKAPSDYYYLSQSGCDTIKGVNDSADFEEVITAMKTLQFSTELIDEIFQILVLVLNLGNLMFVDGPVGSNGDPTAALNRQSQEYLILSSEFLGVESPILFHSLTEKLIQVGRNSVVSIKLSRSQAEDARDTLAKSIYSNLFDWTIKRINTTLQTSDETYYSIGILDIFGFEVFTVNSFEQLCINYANEKLQYHFNEVIFHEETEMYRNEGVSLEQVVFEDNSECVNLIEGKPFGVFSLLDEECSLGKATDLTFVNKLEKTFGQGKQYANNFFIKHRTNQDIFSVKHFAGAVEYNVTNFLDKNRDTMSATTLDMLKSAQSQLIQTIFEEEFTKNLSLASNTTSQSSKSNKLTLGGKFRGQLIGLVNNLYKTESHFIRCVKPNHDKKPLAMDSKLTLRQLRYAGLFEAIRIRKAGYSYRSTHDVFANTYQILVDDLRSLRLKGQVNSKDACRLILETMTKEKLFTKDVWEIGVTKVFLRSNVHRTFLERRKATRVTLFVIAIQALIRGHIVREKYRKIRDAWLYEKRKQALIQKRKDDAATVIQKHIRRYLVMTSLIILRDLVRLRRYVKKQDIPNIRALVKEVEVQVSNLVNQSSSPSNSQSVSNNNASRQSLSAAKKRDLNVLKYHIKNKIMDKSMSYLTIKVFQKEIMTAKACVKLRELQDQYIIDLETAIENKDVITLNQLLVKAERLDMTGHEAIAQAKLLLSKLNEKRIVIKQMIAFLQNADDGLQGYDESDGKTLFDNDSDAYSGMSKTQIILQKAKELDIDADFVSKVERVYVSVGPRIETRSLLRRSIETVDRYGILQGIKKIEELQIHHPNFAESEVRAGNAMLRLLDFDSQLCSDSDDRSERSSMIHDDEEGNRLRPRGDIADKNESPRLTYELIELCDEISLLTASIDSLKQQSSLSKSAAEIKLNEEKLIRDRNKLKLCKQQLTNFAKTPLELETIIRSYKWTKLLCPWKFPEITGKASSSMSHLKMKSPIVTPTVVVRKEEAFYGLNITEARSNTYLIRLLHREIDPVIGDVPASLQAGMGGLHLPYAVTSTLEEYEAIDRFNQQRKQYMASLANATTINNTTSSARRASIQQSTQLSSNEGKIESSTLKKKTSSSKNIVTEDDFSSIHKQLIKSRQAVEEQRKILERTKAKFMKVESKKQWK